MKYLLKITDSGPILVLIFILFLQWISPITGGILRGVKRFFAMSFVNVTNSFFKMIFGVLFVILGFGVSGALMGAVFGMLIALAISIIFIKGYVKPNNPHEPDFRFSSFYSYSLPVLIVMIGLSVPSNIDVILVKYFYSALDAGIYTSVAVFGKIIFFIPGAIGVMMFPMIIEKHVKGENGIGILKKSLLYTGILSGSVVLVYAIFPEIIVKMFGAKYEMGVDLVVLYGIGMFLFSLIAILANYHLAMKNTRYVVIFAVFIIFEIIMMTMFHSTILEMVETLVTGNILLLIASMVYTFGSIAKWRNMTEKFLESSIIRRI